MSAKTKQQDRDLFHDLVPDLVNLNAKLGLAIGKLMSAKTYPDLADRANELISAADALERLAHEVAASD